MFEMWGIISAFLIAISWIISKIWLHGEYLGEMTIVSFFVPAIINMFIKLKKNMGK